MAIRFIIDSASDILPEEAEELGMIYLPMTVQFGNEEFRDRIDFTSREFYERLIESDTLPATSQIPPAVYEEAYKQVVSAGDTAVVITISGKLSGSCQSAVLAAQDFEGKVFVVDSENVCIGERILVMRGLELIQEGLSAEQIVEKLNEEKHHIRLLALLDTLEYLKKGGRISTATALTGGLLSIKPVVSVENGEVLLAGKARGSKQGNNLIRTLINECGGVDFSKPHCLAYTGLTDMTLRKYMEDNADIWKEHTQDIPVVTVGSVIGTHVGPGAIAAAFFVP